MASNIDSPGAPDYTKLEEQTAASSKAAMDAQTAANRPNQTDPYGNTSTWTQDPTTGAWSQKTTLSGANQSALDQQNAIRSGLLGQAAGSLGQPMDMSGIQAWSDPSKLGGGQFNMDPTGNSKAIQDATYGLLKPQRDQQRASEIQRLKNQGLTEDSPAFQRAMARLGTDDTDAQMKSLLAGTTEYGNIYNRGLQQNQSNFGQNLQGQTLANQLRGQQVNERAGLRTQPLSELTALSGAGLFNKPEFSQFGSAGNAGGADYTNAASKQYQDMIAAMNAKQAGRANDMGALFGLGSDFLGSESGGKFMDWAGGALKEGGGDLWNWAKGMWGGS